MNLLSTLLGAYLLPTSIAQNIFGHPNVSFINPKGATCGLDPIWIAHACQLDNNHEHTSLDTNDVLCDRDHDCCYCTSINCMGDCSSFVISGDYGAAYVDYEIAGADGGVKMECTGDSACRGAGVNTNKITEIDCEGQFSCADTDDSWSVVCGDGNDTPPCKMVCSGFASCAGGTGDLDVGSGLSPSNISLYNISNIEELQCNAGQSCQNSYFDLTAPVCNDVGENQENCYVNVSCSGTQSCKQSTLETTYGKNVVCGAVEACYESTITVTDPNPSFLLTCNDTQSCNYAEIAIRITDCDLYDGNREILGFDFAELAGVDAAIYLENQCDDTLIIDKLDCSENGSCNNMEIIVVGGDVEIEDCDCGLNGQGCDGTTGFPAVCAKNRTTTVPTEAPTSSAPTDNPSQEPTPSPSTPPTAPPTAGPTQELSAVPTAGPTQKPTPSPNSEPTTMPTAEPTVLDQDGVASESDTHWYHEDFVTASFIEFCIVLIVIILLAVAVCAVCFYRRKRENVVTVQWDIPQKESKGTSNDTEPMEMVTVQKANYSLIEGAGTSPQSNGRTDALQEEPEMAVLPVEDDEHSGFSVGVGSVSDCNDVIYDRVVHVTPSAHNKN